MSDQIEAAGALMTAGLAAHSLDAPAAGDGAPGGACANCGATLSGTFCARCGQRAHLHRSLADIGHELLHGITHFDSKTWRTLPLLLWNPGKLTRDYVMGQRARYIGPVPLFLLTVFLMFLLFSFLPVNFGGADMPERAMTVAEAQRALPQIEADLARLNAELAAAEAAGDKAALTAGRLARAGLETARTRVSARARGEVADPLDLPDAVQGAIRGGNVEVNLGFADVSQQVRKALNNPDLVLYKIRNKAYKLSFLLVPLSLPWVWLLFAFRRDLHVYDHAVFTLYSVSFMAMMFMVVTIASALNVQAAGFYATALVLVPLAHMFLQLKGAYALSAGAALWRTGVLAVGALVSLSLYLAVMLVLGVLD